MRTSVVLTWWVLAVGCGNVDPTLVAVDAGQPARFDAGTIEPSPTPPPSSSFRYELPLGLGLWAVQASCNGKETRDPPAPSLAPTVLPGQRAHQAACGETGALATGQQGWTLAQGRLTVTAKGRTEATSKEGQDALATLGSTLNFRVCARLTDGKVLRVRVGGQGTLRGDEFGSAIQSVDGPGVVLERTATASPAFDRVFTLSETGCLDFLTLLRVRATPPTNAATGQRFTGNAEGDVATTFVATLE